ncbi:diacylglycerol/lipid kinase family protein, partial [Rubrivirga sp.]|uniref:diacylglycerol/lipid kinase family protein n=1 Tax=Rubrivirga sp. TaxID=1885344 RepID=UPI003C75B7E6
AAANVVACDLGRVRWTDAAGEGGNRHFMNCLGAGFDAHAAALAAQTKWLGGQAAYLVAVVRTLWLWRRPRVRAHVRELVEAGREAGRDGFDLDGPLFLCEFGNGHSVGGGFLLTPDAVPTDGLLDVCHVRHISTRRALRLLPKSLTGEHVSAPEVTMSRTTGVGLSVLEGGLPLQADGEILTYDAVEVEVEVEPAALPVRVGKMTR